MSTKPRQTRRDFLAVGTIAGGAACLPAFAGTDKPKAEPPKGEAAPAEEVTPAEDLMREHGLLSRILLIYQESAQRLSGAKEVDLAVLSAAAKIVRTFVEDYHEKLEEDHLFPRFEKAGKLVSLVQVLRAQHQAGRRLTGEIQQLAAPAALKDAEGGQKLVRPLRQFIRMYRPHKAREDTVLFPAIRSLMTPKEYDAMGEQFEDREHEVFGPRGFEDVVEQVARLEKPLGLDDLARFTPKG